MEPRPLPSPSMSASQRPTDSLRLVHWNIKELDTLKLSQPEHLQVQAAADIFQALGADLFSINEVHHDPTRDNLGAFLGHCDPQKTLPYYRLSPSNTGLRSDPARQILDRSNFGFFPGQYATGFASRFPLEKTLEIQKLRWKEWEPNIDLTSFNLGGVHPDEIELFDKSFTVHWLTIEGRSLAVVCLHTVPAFNFGQDKSPNAQRNRAQLEFLRWFLTGEPRPHLTAQGIEPLRQDQAFLAMGDFNCPLRDKNCPGGPVLQSLLADPRVDPQLARIAPTILWDLPRLDPTITFFADGWDYNRLPTELDYVLVSRELKIHNLEVIFANPDRRIHGLYDPDSDLTPLLEALAEPGRKVGLQRGISFGRADQVAVVSVS
ncbi:MAG: endonuclease/exonuclease/phosphatase family protein, partial [Pseudobdellovibrionaceae bacterium]|nr:endonuclease/exonuclease/phosphatase family protein [Pseudobdellovibrionaceae bacterium]